MNLFKSPESKLLEDKEIELVVAEMNAGYLDDVAFAKALESERKRRLCKVDLHRRTAL